MSYIALALTAFGGWAMISAENKEAKKIEEKKIAEAEKREQEKIAEAEKQRQLELQREKNGGLTDKELQEQKLRQKEKEEREKFQEYLNTLSDEVQNSFKNEKICIGMPMDLVGLLKGNKYEEKRNVTKKAEKLTYKYGKTGTNSRGNPQYELEITYIDNLVDSFKDL